MIPKLARVVPCTALPIATAGTSKGVPKIDGQALPINSEGIEGNLPSSGEKPNSTSSNVDITRKDTVRPPSVHSIGVLILPENKRNLSERSKPVNHCQTLTSLLWIS